jgi:hypothetical protein
MANNQEIVAKEFVELYHEIIKTNSKIITNSDITTYVNNEYLLICKSNKMIIASKITGKKLYVAYHNKGELLSIDKF